MQLARTYEHHLIKCILANYDFQLRENLLEEIEDNYAEFRKEKRALKQSLDKHVVVVQDRNSVRVGDGNKIVERLKWIRIRDFRKVYHLRILAIYKEEYGLNIQRILNTLLSFSIFLVSIARIIIHMFFFVYPEEFDKVDSSYSIKHTAYTNAILIAILVNFFLYEVIRKNTIGNSVNRTKQRNALIRLTNMISWKRDSTYFMPKEVPTMNLYCKISWVSWYNARRVVESLYDTQKTILDFA